MAEKEDTYGFDPRTGEFKFLSTPPVRVLPGLIESRQTAKPVWASRDYYDRVPVMYGVDAPFRSAPQYFLRNHVDVKNAERDVATPRAVRAMEAGASTVFDIRGAADLGRAARRVVRTLGDLKGEKATSDDFVQVAGALVTGRILGSAGVRQSRITGGKVLRSAYGKMRETSSIERAIGAAEQRVAELNSEFVAARGRAGSAYDAAGKLQPPELNLKTYKRIGPKRRAKIAGQIEAQREYTRQAGEVASELARSDDAVAKAQDAVQKAVSDLGSLRDDTLFARARNTLSRGEQRAVAAREAAKPARVAERVRKLKRADDVQFKEALRRAAEPSAVKSATSEPGWFRRAAGWTGRMLVAPFDFRPSKWKAHPWKTVAKGIADAGVVYAGIGAYRNKKANDSQMRFEASRNALSVQNAVNRNAEAFGALSPEAIASAADSNDFGPFDAARTVIGASIWNATNPHSASATNKVSYADAEALARGLPKRAWYKYVSDKFRGQTGRFVRAEDGKTLDMSREDDVAEYGVQDFLDQSKYREGPVK